MFIFYKIVILYRQKSLSVLDFITFLSFIRQCTIVFPFSEMHFHKNLLYFPKICAIIYFTYPYLKIQERNRDRVNVQKKFLLQEFLSTIRRKYDYTGRKVL